ncbi:MULTISPECIES: CDP-glucose 4,6-dehydratase [Bacillaceae]|uniref:CDP-glucose 4,6-dehydratase n=1 Tax=Bacillaceae TaxID=186817 RepID=UPI0006617534|nr:MULTISPECIES: CDP-glucose 4,6-dehydratase [Bacillaceae]MCF7622623.1 CDP-glucose 4,6-dehydratase [Peribacillus frigoritolerans]PRA84427.1 CDP-glucose 4,6-dehydratase [Peribacillus simplex]
MNKDFWNRKKVLVTGHTGFKGSWLCLLLYSLGAKVTGYSMRPPTSPSLFELCRIDQLIPTRYADIRNIHTLQSTILELKPEIVIHMAAQPLVRTSYLNPVETYEINVMGTVHLLEAVRNAIHKGIPIKAVINVTTDKCYGNKEWFWGYRENDVLGGYDPYSSSKACSELVTEAYRKSFFNLEDYESHGVGVATARAGNVIGGGDWAVDRLIPDCIKTLLRGEKIKIRNPYAIRPWQHVLDPLSGYLLLVEKLYSDGKQYSEGWNFGPDDDSGKSVEWVVKSLCSKWGEDATYEIENGRHLHEAHQLRLDCSKAKFKLGWYPKWNTECAIDKVIEWTQAYQSNSDLMAVCMKQIDEYRNIDMKSI